MMKGKSLSFNGFNTHKNTSSFCPRGETLLYWFFWHHKNSWEGSLNVSPSGFYKANLRQGDRISFTLLWATWKELVHTLRHQGHTSSALTQAVAFHFSPIVFTRLQVPLEIMINQSAQSQQQGKCAVYSTKAAQGHSHQRGILLQTSPTPLFPLQKVTKNTQL